MNEFSAAFHADMDAALAEKLKDAGHREHVVTILVAGFADVKKKPVSDLELRLKNMEERFRLLVKNISVGFVNGRLVVKVAGSSESLLKELRHGSTWYEPWDKVDEVLLAASLSDQAK